MARIYILLAVVLAAAAGVYMIRQDAVDDYRAGQAEDFIKGTKDVQTIIDGVPVDDCGVLERLREAAGIRGASGCDPNAGSATGNSPR